jgi:sec-independent protein translocase protein TatC
MGFLEHLEELRKRLLLSLLSVAVAFLLALAFSKRILDFFLVPIRPFLGESRPVFIDLTEPFLLYMKVAFLAALFVAAPLIMYQAWAFISFASVFFLGGGAFGYYVGFPAASRFLLEVGEGFEPTLRVSNLFSFESKIVLGMALVFELPTVIYFLARLGLVTPGFLWRKFKYAILIIFVIAAIITPTPDIVTQCVFAAPMILLYLAGILVAKIFGRPRGGPDEPEAG